MKSIIPQAENLHYDSSVQNLNDQSRARYFMALEYGISASEALNLLYTYEDLDEGVFIEYLKITMEIAKRKGPYV